MSRQVFASGFESIDVATRVAESLQKYHNARHHKLGQPLFMKDLPEGHLVVVLRKCENGTTISIPLYSSEPRSHGYETVKDLMEIIKRIDPEYNNTAEILKIELPAL
ncbi:MAG: hypothetical protein AABX39_04970 [Nanoarchaeota archaeon]